MADIILAQLGWNTWMVKGEDLLDDLLVNSLPDDVTIEFITCESESDVHAMWHASVKDPDAAGPAWLIHPAIVDRARRMMGLGGTFAVVFPAWSAAFDDNARTTIGNAIEAAQGDPAARVTLIATLAADAPPFAADLANIRAGMVEKDLLAGGVDAGRIQRDQRTAGPDDAEAVDHIIIEVARD